MATHEEQALEPQGASTPGATQPAGRHTLKATPQSKGGFDEEMDPAFAERSVFRGRPPLACSAKSMTSCASTST